MQVWKNFKENYTFINDMFEKYDTDKSGDLSKEQLRPLLVELNEDDEVTEAEVDKVISLADTQGTNGKGDGRIDKLELMRAVAVWYSDVDSKNPNVQETEEPASPTPPKEEEGQVASSCACIVQ